MSQAASLSSMGAGPSICDAMALAKRVLQGCAFLILEIAVLFIAAGQTDFPRAWLYFGLYAVLLVSNFWIFSKYNPGLIEERGEIIQGTKSWDLAFLVAYSVLQIATPAIAGYDLGHYRIFDLGLAYLCVGILLYAIGASIATWAMVRNRFFASTVVVQENQAVISTGPYSVIRHPGYAGILLMTIAFPLIVGSSLALIPAGLVVLLFLARTFLEDKTLQEELPGYSVYAKKVRSRLLPGAW